MGTPSYPRTIAVARSNTIGAVYGWMATGLCLTALVSVAVVSSPELFRMVYGNRLVFFGAVIAELALVVGISGFAARLGTAKAAPLFLVYSALNGVTLSGIFLLYTGQSISSAFFSTAGTFGVMSLYGIATKRDLTSLGSFCFMGLIGLVIASVVNIFLHSNMLQFVASGVGLIVFIGLTAYDTQRLKGVQGGAAVAGALSLYLNFVNMFLMILQLFGTRRD
ncbi:Bax inhibitor-1/YccA family protein [Geobacter sp. SVR]|uniref:Bax inhibitor-1/YccA family protein n=1 Tax=Geobacter sp. SVR TaxID=2495594 RepID=UPI00143F005B|nr:Bax inhibitor-1/YccA family protein [Geobacter sp. SVR]BCS54630.1 membrane protein [Geobacter sp. SVR]GCF86862.1 membrane protein [Geobacter sp. SVR]